MGPRPNFLIGLVLWISSIRQCCGVDYEVLALLPLSGPRASEGQLLRRTIQDAWNIPANTHGNTILTIVDTQCNPAVEEDEILRNLYSSKRYFVLLGGGCSGSQRETSGFPVTSSVVPRVSFLGPSLSASVEDPPSVYHVTPSARGVFRAIATFLTKASVDDVTLVSDQQDIHAQTDAVYKTLVVAGIPLVTHATWRPGNTLTSITRAVIININGARLKNFICDLRHLPSTQHTIWLIPWLSYSSVNTSVLTCDGFKPETIYIFSADHSYIHSQIFQDFVTTVHSLISPTPSIPIIIDAAHARDATYLISLAMQRLANITSADHFSREFRKQILNMEYNGVTGQTRFQSNGLRKYDINVDTVTASGEVVPKGLYHNGQFTDGSLEDIPGLRPSGNMTVDRELDGIPLYLLIIMTSLSGLGMVYAVAIMVFNLSKRTDKILKMTSPNINVIILLGCVLAYSSVVLLGLDSNTVAPSTMSKLHQAVTFILALSFTFVYGSTLTKSWRVFMIFKNLNMNGRLTRDEHLVIGVLLLTLVDLAMLLSWTLTDPITCTQTPVNFRYKDGELASVTLIDVCWSRLQILWVLLLYSYKAVMLALAAYFGWKTRHVTLPALQDVNYVYIVVYSVSSFGVLSLPLLLTSHVSMTLKYAASSLTIIICTTATISLLFLPKILLLRKNKKKDEDDTKLMFSESMRKTQEAAGRCHWLLCCGPREDDPYAQEMLASEIDHLKRTIRQKDSTIRELNDRLYFEKNTDKASGMYQSPKYHYYVMRSKHNLERQSQRSQLSRPYVDESGRYSPGSDQPLQVARHLPLESFADRDIPPLNIAELSANSLPQADIIIHHDPPPVSMKQSVMSHATETYIPQYDRDPKESEWRTTPSPNADSAIENASPSTDSSERGSVDGFDAPAHAHSCQTSDLDLEGMNGDDYHKYPMDYRTVPKHQIYTSTPRRHKIVVSQI